MSSAYAPTLDTSMEDYKALRDTFVDDTKDLELERILAIYAEDRQFREALKQHSMEAYGEVAADAPESIDLANAIFSKDNIVFAGKTAKAVGKVSLPSPRVSRTSLLAFTATPSTRL